MKLAPVTKLDKGDKTMAKRFDNDVMSANCNIIVIFPIYSQLEQSGRQIPDVQFVKVTFSLIETFFLTKTKNRTKRSLTKLPHYFFNIKYNIKFQA